MANRDVGYDAAGVAKTYATIALAYAAASNGDTIRLYYSGPQKQNFWDVVALDSGWSAKAVSFTGMLDEPACILYRGASYWMSTSAIGSELAFSNLAFRATAGGVLQLWFGVGGGATVDRCIFRDAAGAAVNWFNTAGSAVVRNCLFETCAIGVIPVAGVQIFASTFAHCDQGIIATGILATITGCLFVENTAHIPGHASANISYCVGTKTAAGASEVWSGTGNQCDRTTEELGLWKDRSDPAVCDWRPETDGYPVGKGVAIGGVTLDLAGETRADPPTAGAYEGVDWPSSSSCTYADADDVRLGVDRGDGTPGTCRVPAVGQTASGVVYDANDSLTGTYVTPAVQSAAPSALAITDTGDGLTWTVTATGQAAGAAIALYSGASLVAIMDASARTRDLTAGQTLTAKALESGKTLSTASPSALVPALTPNHAPLAAELEDGVAVRVDGVAITGTLVCGECAPLEPVAGEQLYRVVEVRAIPGATHKEIVVEKIAKPTWLGTT